MRLLFWLLIAISLACLLMKETSLLAEDGELQVTGMAESEADFRPDQSQFLAEPPKDAIVLFDDGTTIEFVNKRGDSIDWPVKEGALESSGGSGKKRSNHIVSNWHFRDADIHAEFMLPDKSPGNSGLYIHGNYEIQIIHSFGKESPGNDDMGAVYGFSKPLVNAARDRGSWQVYDIRYRAPRRDERGEIVKPGTITAWLNGKMVQDATEIGEPRSAYHPYRYGATEYLKKISAKQKATMTGPLFLQDHGNPVRFRNVWIRPLDEHAHQYSVKE